MLLRTEMYLFELGHVLTCVRNIARHFVNDVRCYMDGTSTLIGPCVITKVSLPASYFLAAVGNISQVARSH